MDRKPTFFRIAASSMLVLLLQGQPADATPTYRWVDDNGNPVLSDRPPRSGTPYTEIEIKTGLTRYAKPATTVPKPSSTASAPTAQQGVAFTAADVNESVLPSASESECAALDADIQKLVNYPRIIVRDDVGEEHLLGPKERVTRLEEALALSDKLCRH